jgi:hypothetical protein
MHRSLLQQLIGQFGVIIGHDLPPEMGEANPH